VIAIPGPTLFNSCDTNDERIQNTSESIIATITLEEDHPNQTLQVDDAVVVPTIGFAEPILIPEIQADLPTASSNGTYQSFWPCMFSTMIMLMLCTCCVLADSTFTRSLFPLYRSRIRSANGEKYDHATTFV
jgi:hypothetical protein